MKGIPSPASSPVSSQVSHNASLSSSLPVPQTTEVMPIQESGSTVAAEPVDDEPAVPLPWVNED